MIENLQFILIISLTLLAALAVVFIAFTLVVRGHLARQRKKVESFGRGSEQQVEAILKKAFGDESVLTGIYLPYINLDYDKFAEIDHILILRSGIFVIEVKSHNGYINNPNQHDWWQTYNDKKIRFYNPLRQNNTHTKIVSEILKANGQYNVPIYSVVVFTSNRVTFARKYDNLVQKRELVGYIKRVGKKNAIPAAQLRRVKSIITGAAATGSSVERKHRSAMRRYQEKNRYQSKNKQNRSE